VIWKFFIVSLVKRFCPFCNADKYKILVALQQEQFTKTNPTYNFDRISELQLKSDTSYPIVSCYGCEMIYSLFHLDDERESILYNRVISPEISKSKILTWGRRFSDLQRWMGLLELSRISWSSQLEIKILDYGCGWGTQLMVTQGPGVTAVGFDVTSWKLDWGRQQGITIVDSEDELFKWAPFDLCICSEVLEHLRSPRKAINTIASLLRPGAYAYITCIIPAVAKPSGWKKIRRKLDQKAPIPKEINPWEHLNYFTQKKLTKMLKQAGFKPLKRPGKWLGKQYVVAHCVEHILRRYWSNRLSGYWRLEKP
jgi:SAM-dependent methyltransferase